MKLIVLFGKPKDRTAFDAYFTDHHHPLLSDIPGVERVTVNRIAGAAKGDSPYQLITELEFPSEEAMQAGLNSEAGQSMARDFARFASGGFTVLFSETLEEPQI
ncbi:MAG: EthD family reductase [Acidobacteriota bacterium]